MNKTILHSKILRTYVNYFVTSHETGEDEFWRRSKPTGKFHNFETLQPVEIIYSPNLAAHKLTQKTTT